MLDHVFSNSTSFSAVCSRDCSCPCTPQVGAEGLIQAQRSLQQPQHLLGELASSSESLGGSWTPPEAVETRGQAWPEQKGRPWKAERFPLSKFWLQKEPDVTQLPFNLQSWLSDGDNHKGLLVLRLG